MVFDVISFIIDGYDPWENILPLLEQIKLEIAGQCEVILATSLLLDTPLAECEAKGKALFGDDFYLFATDNTGVFETRLEAQAQAKGDTFFYLSPVIKPGSGALNILAQGLNKESGIFCLSAPLTYLYPNGSHEKVLANGYGSAENGVIVSLFTGQNPDCLQGKTKNIIPMPFAFCSKGPFYNSDDMVGSFWQSHLQACARNKNHCASMSKAPCRLNSKIFSSYHERLGAARYSGAATIEAVAACNRIPVAMSAYGDYLAGARMEDKPLPQSQEDIFWALLTNPSPAFVANACEHKMEEPLAVLARKTLLKMASTSWDEANNKAKRYLKPYPGWQTYNEWHSLYKPLKDTAYAVNSPDWRQIFKNPKSAMQILGNTAMVFAKGLFRQLR